MAARARCAVADPVSPIQELILRNGEWVRRGYVPPSAITGGGGEPAARRTDWGAYEPTTQTAGFIQGSDLDMYVPPGDRVWREQRPNVTVSNVEVFGTLKPEAPGIVYENCLVHGKPMEALTNGWHQPLGDSVSTLTNSGPPTIYRDCTFMPGAVVGGVDGVKGGHFRLERCHIAGIDGVHIYRRNASMYGSLVSRLFWIPDDPAHGPEGSHNDGVQFVGGAGVTWTMVGNSINNGYEPYGSSNLGILVGNNEGTPTRYVIEDNWFRTKLPNGSRVAIPLNLSITLTNFSVKRNKIQLGRDGYHIIARTAIADQVRDEPGNVDLDTGQPVIVQNGG